MEYTYTMESYEINELDINDIKSLNDLRDYNFLRKYYADKNGNVYIINEDTIHNGKVFGRKLKPYINRDHYTEYVLLTEDKKPKHIQGQRIVAGLFIPQEDENKKFVNHIDGNRSNNHIKNLEWVNHSENVYHSWNTIRNDENKTHYTRRLPIHQG